MQKNWQDIKKTGSHQARWRVVQSMLLHAFPRQAVTRSLLRRATAFRTLAGALAVRSGFWPSRGRRGSCSRRQSAALTTIGSLKLRNFTNFPGMVSLWPTYPPTFDNELRIAPEEHPDLKDSYVGDEAQSKRRKLLDEFDTNKLREWSEGAGRLCVRLKGTGVSTGGRAHSSHLGQFFMLFTGKSPECDSEARRANSRTTHTRCSWWSTVSFFTRTLCASVFQAHSFT